MGAMKDLADQNQDALTWAALVLDNDAEERRGLGGKTTRDYVKRLRATSKRLRQMAGQRWVRVSERLPEPHEKVIALDDCGNAHIAAQHQFEEDAPFARGTCSHRVGSLWTNEWRAISGVTHWMPLPEPPEVK